MFLLPLSKEKKTKRFFGRSIFFSRPLAAYFFFRQKMLDFQIAVLPAGCCSWVVPADTLGQMFAAQKSVLAAASFLSCQKEAAASFLSYFAAASFLPYFSDSLRGRDRRTRAGIVWSHMHARERCPRPFLVRLLGQAANARVPRWLKLTLKCVCMFHWERARWEVARKALLQTKTQTHPWT